MRRKWHAGRTKFLFEKTKKYTYIISIFAKDFNVY